MYRFFHSLNLTFEERHFLQSADCSCATHDRSQPDLCPDIQITCVHLLPVESQGTLIFEHSIYWVSIYWNNRCTNLSTGIVFEQRYFAATLSSLHMCMFNAIAIEICPHVLTFALAVELLPLVLDGFHQLIFFTLSMPRTVRRTFEIQFTSQTSWPLMACTLARSLVAVAAARALV